MLVYVLFLAGLALLVKGGDLLVDGSSALARRVGISPLVIGLTIVAFGTSLPELIVSVLAAIQGSSDIAFGNVVGSNMANILLILGLGAVIAPLAVQRSTVWKEIPFSFLAAAALLAFAAAPLTDGVGINALLRFEGIILMLFFVIFVVYVVEMARSAPAQGGFVEVHKHSVRACWLMIACGLAGLYFGGRWTVDGAVHIARGLGLSEFIIAATVIAVGTSLPELVTTVIAARKGNVDLAVGNVVGSNIFNILWILGLTAIIRPIAFSAYAIADLALLLGVTFLLFACMFLGRKHTLSRWQGVMFLVLYAAYIAFIVAREAV